MHYLVLIAGISSLFIGFLALISNEGKKETKLFAIFCFITSTWIILNFFFLYFKETKYLGPIYASGTLLSASLLSWTYVYVRKGNRKWKHVLIYAVAGIIVLLSLFTDAIVGEVSHIDSSGIKIEEGYLFPLFGVFLSGSIIMSLIKIFIVLRASKGKSRKKLKMVFFGIAGFTGISTLVSSILPMFGIFSFTNLDSPCALFFVIFTYFAIVRYRFLKIKIVLAHLFVSIIVVLSAVEIFFSTTVEMIVIRTLFFFTFLLTGIMFLNSISSEVKDKEQLETANKKLLEMDQIKSEFISMASHQLRTPLTTMKGFISVMKNGSYGKVPKNFDEPLGIMDTANERLILLVEEMLNVSQIESGKMAFHFKKENINELIDELADSFRIAAKSRGLSLIIKKSMHLPQVCIDYNKMRETLSNIIDNAIKYTHEGEVVVRTRRQGDFVVILVKDTGIGFADNEKYHLFEKFVRGERARALKKSGVGLGLYLGKRIIEAHHGTISARQNTNEPGATFIVKLPLN